MIKKMVCLFNLSKTNNLLPFVEYILQTLKDVLQPIFEVCYKKKKRKPEMSLQLKNHCQNLLQSIKTNNNRNT